ncbi:MAG: hypothetical protein OEZ51_14710 [Nitrospinota bacterium]|nr:hypothetical protein [Nitrospinota bacterium]
MSPLSAADDALPKTFKGTDPKGWRQFHWQMTQAGAAQAGAEPFVDAAGERRFGLPSVELLPGKTFRVRLEFFSSMGLNAVRVTLAPHEKCATDVYETFLNNFRETTARRWKRGISRITTRITKATTGLSAPPRSFCITPAPNPASPPLRHPPPTSGTKNAWNSNPGIGKEFNCSYSMGITS